MSNEPTLFEMRAIGAGANVAATTLKQPSHTSALPASSLPSERIGLWFIRCFLEDLTQIGPGTASETRKRHAIPHSNEIGQAVQSLSRKHKIFRTDYRPSVMLDAHGRPEGVWALSNPRASR
jgi:hypothetical protein